MGHVEYSAAVTWAKIVDTGQHVEGSHTYATVFVETTVFVEIRGLPTTIQKSIGRVATRRSQNLGGEMVRE
jgi:hypothetical protein